MPAADQHTASHARYTSVHGAGVARLALMRMGSQKRSTMASLQTDVSPSHYRLWSLACNKADRPTQSAATYDWATSSALCMYSRCEA